MYLGKITKDYYSNPSFAVQNLFEKVRKLEACRYCKHRHERVSFYIQNNSLLFKDEEDSSGIKVFCKLYEYDERAKVDLDKKYAKYMWKHRKIKRMQFIRRDRINYDSKVLDSSKVHTFKERMAYCSYYLLYNKPHRKGRI